MSRTLLTRDNISVSWEILNSKDIDTWKEYDYELKLTFTILVNGKLKVWCCNYDLCKSDIKEYGLKDYSAWYDIKDLLQTMWYDLEEVNILNWIENFEI